MSKFVPLSRGRFVAINVFLTLAFSPFVKADAVISDSFTPTGDNRQVGAGLSGTKTEQGGAMWLANSRFKFAGSVQDGWIISSASGGGSARVPIPAGATSVKIELDFKFETSDTARWVGVGLGDNDSDSTFFKEPTGILLCLSNTGGGRFCAGPDAVRIGKNAAKLAKEGEFNHLVLFYNLTANTVSAWINAAPMCPEQTPCPVPLKADYGGFACYGLGTEAKIDNFKITVEGGAASSAKP